MWRRLAVALVAALAAGCSSNSSDGTHGGASPSPAADNPVVHYYLDKDDIAKLGIPLQPVPAGQGVMIGPKNFRFEMTQVGTTTRFTTEQLKVLGGERTEAVSAPAGAEYLVVVAAFDFVANGVEPVFHLGDRVVKQKGLVGSVLVLTAPVGAPVSLDVTHFGRTQTMDLRTGRGSNLVTGYPAPSDGVLIQCYVRVTEPGVKLTNTLHNEAVIAMRLTASVVPWLEDKGWAPNDRQWLLLRPEVQLGALDDELGATVDLAADLTVTGPGGRLPVTGTANTAGTTGGDNRSRSEQAFDVPAGRVALGVTFTFRGTMSFAGKPARYSLGGGPDNTWCGKTQQLRL